MVCVVTTTSHKLAMVSIDARGRRVPRDSGHARVSLHCLISIPTRRMLYQCHHD